MSSAKGAEPWQIFQPFTGTPGSVGTNKIINAGMDVVNASSSLASWTKYSSGYEVETNQPHSATKCLRCRATAAGQIHGAYQVVTLNQSEVRPLRLNGWSKAMDVTGAPDDDYSVYLDISYKDGTWLYGQTLRFSNGSHDWEFQERVILPSKPIAQVYCYLLFRNAHSGTVWFDDVSLNEFLGSITQFDGALVIPAGPQPSPFNPTNRLTLFSGDRLQLDWAEDGGALIGVKDGTNSVFQEGSSYASGWFLCDRIATSSWWHIGGTIAPNGQSSLHQFNDLKDLALSVDTIYSVTNHAIRAQVTVSNRASFDRALSLYFALPVSIDGASWWSSLREKASVEDAVESATLTSIGWGARNLVNQYPVSAVAGKTALTLAVPPEPYCPFRIVYNNALHLFYVAFDFGLSTNQLRSPESISLEVWLYRTEPEWGLRSSLDGLYRCFPKSFNRQFTNEGSWVAFADLRGITNLADFGIGYHEISYEATQVVNDDRQGIPSFRYVSEPWSYWMNLPTTISNTDSNAVTQYLQQQAQAGNEAAIATLNSGIRNPTGQLQFFPAAQPWCPYGAAFYVNASPFLSPADRSTTKFTMAWNPSVQAVYLHPESGELDGEYIDSFSSYGDVPDYAPAHLRSTSLPLLYTSESTQLMTPVQFGAVEMAEAIGAEVHARNKPLIANGVFVWPYLPLGVGLFDFAGAEINWFDSGGRLVQPEDGPLLFARAMSAKRPYGYLLNTDFSRVSHDEMESYMRLCAVYGIYPSAFSADAATRNYFEQPNLYERDRDLFRKYIPIVRRLSLAGWEPVTEATSTNAKVVIERYGSVVSDSPGYLTLRNLSASPQSTRLEFNVKRWAPAHTRTLWLTNMFDSDFHVLDVWHGSNTLALTLQPNETCAYAIHCELLRPPRILTDDPNFGLHQQRLGFRVSGPPGDSVVIETSLELRDWSTVQTNVLGLDGSALFVDPDWAESARKFYRARLLAR